MKGLQKRFNCSGGWIIFLLWGAMIYIASIMIILAAHGAAAFPPIAFLAQQLNISAGQTLPKGVVWNGRPYTFYVVSAKELPNGRYAVVIGAR